MKLHRLGRAATAAVVTAGIALVSVGVAGASGPTGPSPFPPAGPAPGHALFVETDAAPQNQVLSYDVASDGTISFGHSYLTGGRGGTAAGATADPLASQGGLALVDDAHELVATNAGSNTISVFAVDGSQLSFLQQLPSGGLFPDSIASSGDLVAVLNAGGAGSVAEFRMFNGHLSPLPGEIRSLQLANTTPPDFHHGAGEVAYTPNGQHLVITTKLSTNAYDVFSVSRTGDLGAQPKSNPADTALPFAFVFDAAGNIVGAEAFTSSVSDYAVNPDGSLHSLGTVSDGASALCWISGANGFFYGSNAGSADVSEFAEGPGNAPQLVNADAATTHAGTTDSVVSPNGAYLYVESGGAGTIDAFAIGAGGALTPLETIFNIPVGSEGLAIS